MNWIKWLFKPKLRHKRMETGEYAVEAFRHRGKVYYHFTDSFKMPTGRALCALAIYEELRMRCDREYLEKHIRACELILSPADKRINLNALATINNNLKERLNLAPFPDHIYKLASVTFFDETESPYSYDFAYNQIKIAEWKKDGEMLDFFLQTQFKDLMPYSTTSSEDVKSYLNITQQIHEVHRRQLFDIISKSS